MQTHHHDSVFERSLDCSRGFSTLPALKSLFFILALLFADATGQVTPLEDVVPLAELEIRNDDLIRLSTAYADAVRELRNAKLSLATLNALRPNAVITNLEFQIASINAQTAEQKVELLRAITEKLLAAAEAKLSILRGMESFGSRVPGQAAAGAQNRVRIAQAAATVRIIKMILQTK